jgi:uncharacterized protein
MPETSVSRTAVYSPRPTLRIAGQPDERLSALFTSMKVDEAEGGMSRLELKVTNCASTSNNRAELAFDANSTLKLGAELAVYAGDEASPREIFKGRVSALEMVCNEGKPPELVVLAEDGLVAARRGRRSKVYTQMTPAGVVNAIAGDLSLTPSVSGLSSPQGTWAQLDETDLGFLRRLLARFDADLQVVGDRLQVSPRKDVQRGTIALTLNGQLARVRITADLADQATAATVSGWNAKDGTAVKGEASAIANAGPGQGKSGLAWAQEAFGTRSEHLAAPAVFTSDEARAVAEAALDQRARRFVRAEGVADGNAQLRVGCSVRLGGISPQFDNTYYVVSACHRYDTTQGYRTEFSAECAYLGN